MKQMACSHLILLLSSLQLLLLLVYFALYDQPHLTSLYTSFNNSLNNRDANNGSKLVWPNWSFFTSFYTNKHIVQKKRGLEGVEEDLARARAAVLRASQGKTYYVQHKEVGFIPRGSIYRNSFAFHQSHIEMRKRFKVWVYKEGEAPLMHSGPMHDIYSIEGHFIDEMESGKSSFISSHPDEAHAFFLPISVASIVDYVYMPITTYARDQLQRVVADYIRLVADKYPYWNRSGGADHFLVACHDWGPDVSEADPGLYKNVIRVLCNANTSERFEPRRDVSMPDVYCPLGELGPPNLSQPPNSRPILAFFAGGAHGYIRELLLEHWKGKDNEVQVYGYLQEGQNYTQIMGQTKFCLCPSGYQVASPRVVEAIYAGCIPVIISDNFSLPFNDVFNWNQFSLQIPVQKIPEIKAILKGVPFAKYLRMQKRVRRVRRHFELNRPAKPFDVMQMVLHSVWLRRLNVRIPF